MCVLPRPLTPSTAARIVSFGPSADARAARLAAAAAPAVAEKNVLRFSSDMLTPFESWFRHSPEAGRIVIAPVYCTWARSAKKLWTMNACPGMIETVGRCDSAEGPGKKMELRAHRSSLSLQWRLVRRRQSEESSGGESCAEGGKAAP